MCLIAVERKVWTNVCIWHLQAVVRVFHELGVFGISVGHAVRDL